MSKTNETVDDLTRLAIMHGTDKWGPHFYTPVYHSIFSKRRNDPIRLLEIGVGGYENPLLGGTSLSMWADYFPNGHIVGVDINEKTLSLDPRIIIRKGSQTDSAFLKNIVYEYGPFDIIIDDGSHVPQHVVQSFHTLWSTLRDGGYYVIEDTQTSLWEKWGGSLSNGGATMQLARALMDSLNFAEAAVAAPNLKIDDAVKTVRSLQAFHNLIFVEKGNNDEPSSLAYDLKNPIAVDAINTIASQLKSTPTPHGYANLILLYSTGKDFDTGIKVAEYALSQWRNHPAIISAAEVIYRSAGHVKEASMLSTSIDHRTAQ